MLINVHETPMKLPLGVALGFVRLLVFFFGLGVIDTTRNRDLF